jgi:hypothetical protein
MSKHAQKDTGPLSQERYMSSPEFAQLHGVNGVAASARADLLLTARKKSLIWWLQGMSLAEGGLRQLAKELVKMFPDRVKSDQKQFAVSQADRTLDRNHLGWRRTQTLEQFLVDLCVNPRIHFSAPGDDLDIFDIESEKAIDAHPELSQGDFAKARLDYFLDIIGTLFEFKARSETSIREKFQLTAIGKKIWGTLDFALTSRNMVLLDGLEGRGKTEAVKAWCSVHLGVARFVSLKGITSKTTAFREIANSLGIPFNYSRTGSEIQVRIEDVLTRSKLMLVVDEAHFLFNQSRRVPSRPELVDWIDTAICNRGIPIALVTTPQFIVCMTRAADQVGWNYRQFQRRVKRWEKLPATNTEADIKAVARNVFKKADAGMISKIVGYALLSKRDLSAVGDVAGEVRVMLGSDDLSLAKPEHIRRAIYDFLMPCDKSFVEGMAAARNQVKKPGRRPALGLPAPVEALDETPPEPARTAAPSESAAPLVPVARGIVPGQVSGSRRRVGNSADLLPA